MLLCCQLVLLNLGSATIVNNAVSHEWKSEQEKGFLRCAKIYLCVF